MCIKGGLVAVNMEYDLHICTLGKSRHVITTDCTVQSHDCIETP